LFKGEKKVIKNINKNKRALSPVIATVILISVTIVVAVSVAYWMGAIAGGFTSFEQIELPTVYGRAISNSTNPPAPWTGWNITVELKNTGSADATLNNVFLNSIPYKDYTPANMRITADDVDVSASLYTTGVLVSKGNSVTLVLQLKVDQSVGFTAGTRIEIKLHTAGGKDYPTSIKLP
jgi:flagellin-like protein